ncbi:hypothetical protein BJ170DRAFT_683893 [Xylariales sp. AK1849]|nr:hypothetical protein BJ170DRAFT_683893 [Xylariales sp. AK1849]
MSPVACPLLAVPGSSWLAEVEMQPSATRDIRLPQSTKRLNGKDLLAAQADPANTAMQEHLCLESMVSSRPDQTKDIELHSSLFLVVGCIPSSISLTSKMSIAGWGG